MSTCTYLTASDPSTRSTRRSASWTRPRLIFASGTARVDGAAKLSDAAGGRAELTGALSAEGMAEEGVEVEANDRMWCGVIDEVAAPTRPMVRRVRSDRRVATSACCEQAPLSNERADDAIILDKRADGEHVTRV